MLAVGAGCRNQCVPAAWQDWDGQRARNQPHSQYSTSPSCQGFCKGCSDCERKATPLHGFIQQSIASSGTNFSYQLSAVLYLLPTCVRDSLNAARWLSTQKPDQPMCPQNKSRRLAAKLRTHESVATNTPQAILLLDVGLQRFLQVGFSRV